MTRPLLYLLVTVTMVWTWNELNPREEMIPARFVNELQGSLQNMSSLVAENIETNLHLLEEAVWDNPSRRNNLLHVLIVELLEELEMERSRHFGEPVSNSTFSILEAEGIKADFSRIINRIEVRSFTALNYGAEDWGLSSWELALREERLSEGFLAIKETLAGDVEYPMHFVVRLNAEVLRIKSFLFNYFAELMSRPFNIEYELPILCYELSQDSSKIEGFFEVFTVRDVNTPTLHSLSYSDYQGEEYFADSDTFVLPNNQAIYDIEAVLKTENQLTGEVNEYDTKYGYLIYVTPGVAPH